MNYFKPIKKKYIVLINLNKILKIRVKIFLEINNKMN